MPRDARLPKSPSLRIAVDIGGTFTDGVAELTQGGRIWVAKCLTTPDDPGRAVSQVVAGLLGQVGETLGIAGPARRVREVVHGTTLVANTIIERKGARVGLLVTQGTADTLDIGREVRYDLYDLDLELPKPLVPAGLREELDERLDAEGHVLTPLDENRLAVALDKLARKKVQAVAISLLHAYVQDGHEQAVAAHVRRRLPGVPVSLSSEVAREIREYERMSTTTANAYVQPMMGRYLDRLEGRIADLAIKAPLRVMVSSGGFTSTRAGAAQPIQLLESGPAGGVLSAVNTGLEAGIADVLAFDMGGTTAKACVAPGGQPSLAHSFETGRVRRFKKGSGLPILIPSIDLIEIGAGGGSIAHVSRLGLLNVGPMSAGAVPGPACYGQGGQDATVTDADLLLGYLDAENFLGGEMRLRTDLAEAAMGRLAKGLGMTAPEVAWGIVDMVNENMAAAARVHIAEKGHDPRRFTMVATGGAGPVHVVEVAAKLRIRRVLCTIAAGAGSCLGLLAAPARVDRAWSRVALLADVNWSETKSVLGRLHADAVAELGIAGAGGETIAWSLGVEVRYAGQGNTIQVDLPYGAVGPRLGAAIAKEFERAYVRLYGRTVPNAVLQTVTWRLTGKSRGQRHGFRWADGATVAGPVKPIARRRIYLPAKGSSGEAPVYERYQLRPGTRLTGPLVLQERESTIVVARPARVTVLADLTVSIELARPK